MNYLTFTNTHYMSKTHYMVIHRARRKIYHEDTILNNHILQQVHCTQFLGIIIDDKLKWGNHITYIKNKIVKGVGILLNVSKVLKYKCYCSYTIISFFRTLFTVPKYGGTACDIHILPLIILQKSIVRIIGFYDITLQPIISTL